MLLDTLLCKLAEMSVACIPSVSRFWAIVRLFDTQSMVDSAGEGIPVP
jgi:hypothetical protein